MKTFAAKHGGQRSRWYLNVGWEQATMWEVSLRNMRKADDTSLQTHCSRNAERKREEKEEERRREREKHMQYFLFRSNASQWRQSARALSCVAAGRQQLKYENGVHTQVRINNYNLQQNGNILRSVLCHFKIAYGKAVLYECGNCSARNWMRSQF